MGRGGRGSQGCAGACACAPRRVGCLPVCWRRRCPDPHEFTSGASHGPSVPRPPGTARALGHALSLASAAARHLVVLALDRRQCSRPPRDGHSQSGGGRPSLRTQTVPSLGAARRSCRGCPITGVHRASVRRRDRASTPVRRQARSVQTPTRIRARTAERRRSAGARSRVRRRRRAAQVEERRGRQQTQ